MGNIITVNRAKYTGRNSNSAKVTVRHRYFLSLSVTLFMSLWMGDVKDNEDSTRRRVDIVDASHIDLLLALHVLVSKMVFSYTIRKSNANVEALCEPYRN